MNGFIGRLAIKIKDKSLQLWRMPIFTPEPAKKLSDFAHFL